MVSAAKEQFEEKNSLKVGEVYSWGLDLRGQLGHKESKTAVQVKSSGTDNNCEMLPKKLETLKNVKAVYAYANYSIAPKKNGDVYGWGSNFRGKLGK